MVSSVAVGMRTTRAAQATSSARNAAASRTNHQTITRVEEFLLMRDSMSAGCGASHPLDYSYSLGTDTAGLSLRRIDHVGGCFDDPPQGTVGAVVVNAPGVVRALLFEHAEADEAA